MASVTTIFIDNVDQTSTNQTAWYNTWDDGPAAVKGQLIITGNTASTVNIFNITGNVVVASGYYKIPVSYVSGARPANSAQQVLLFIPAYAAIVFG